METIEKKPSYTDVSTTASKKSGKELIKREDIPNSPFEVITTDGKSFGVMGKFRITEEGTKAQIKKELKEITWNRIIQVIMLLSQLQEEQKQQTKK